jgi:hypothetical protein
MENTANLVENRKAAILLQRIAAFELYLGYMLENEHDVCNMANIPQKGTLMAIVIHPHLFH